MLNGSRHTGFIYNTAVQWFEFWLLSRVPQTKREYTRWCLMAKDYPEQSSACLRAHTDLGFNINQRKID